MMTFGNCHNGLLAGSGSSGKTSRAAPASWPFFKASSRAAGSTIPPRETSTRYAPGLRAASALASSRQSAGRPRSEEHTSELQSRQYLVCRLLLEKKKKIMKGIHGEG